MTSWYQLHLGDGITAIEPLEQLRAACHKAFVAAAEPATMALFIRRENESSLHCSVVAYVPPALAALATTAGGQPCTRPGRAGLELIAGHPDAWEILFS
ncbi:MAG: hypothetical protein O3A51_05360 [Verrucomicrobia bacterium]|nr:hypothetical protein [Verrucomicrobiota bacterium]